MTINLGDINVDNICLISKEPIQNKIKLACNHSFEYYYLYEEIKQQKNRHKQYFKCPYCRTKYNGTIPYYEIDDVEKITYINNTNKTLLPILKCSKCTLNANQYKVGTLCTKHYKNVSTVKCITICKNGKKCNNKAVLNELCNLHNKSNNICKALCKNGNSCKKYCVNGYEYCNIHNKKENK